MDVADRVWVARYEWADANVTAIGSDRGLVVVDTHGSTAAGRSVLADLDRLGAGPVVAVVNTHWHWDHSFGNAAFRERDPAVPIHAHEDAAKMLAEQGEHMVSRFAESDDPHRDEVAATELVIPDHTFSSTRSLDLGDRVVELVFPGRGHTDGDLVVVVPDVGVVLGGDLIEESAKPWIGLDSWPLEWHASLDVLRSVGVASPPTVEAACLHLHDAADVKMAARLPSVWERRCVTTPLWSTEVIPANSVTTCTAPDSSLPVSSARTIRVRFMTPDAACIISFSSTTT